MGGSLPVVQRGDLNPQKFIIKQFEKDTHQQKIWPIFYHLSEMISNLLQAEAVLTTLDLFEEKLLLVRFDNPFTKKIGPSYSPDGPMVEFEDIGDKTTSSISKKSLLETQIKQSQKSSYSWHAIFQYERPTLTFFGMHGFGKRSYDRQIKW